MTAANLTIVKAMLMGAAAMPKSVQIRIVSGLVDEMLPFLQADLPRGVNTLDRVQWNDVRTAMVAVGLWMIEHQYAIDLIVQYVEASEERATDGSLPEPQHHDR
jgi:hypothetical protein